MISVGVDVAKGKSTICAIDPYGEILMSPKDCILRQLTAEFAEQNGRDAATAVAAN